MNTRSHEPAVTVLMPVYNGDPFLRDAIDSILQQTWTDFEFLIVNDGSTDHTRDIIDSYRDARIRSSALRAFRRGFRVNTKVSQSFALKIFRPVIAGPTSAYAIIKMINRHF